MAILYLIAYYVIVIGFMAATMFLIVWQAKRRGDATHAQRMQELQRQLREAQSLPPLPPLLPFEYDDEEEDEATDSVPDLSSPALQPIAPLLLRAAKEYLDKPHERERLLRSLREVVGEPAPSS